MIVFCFAKVRCRLGFHDWELWMVLGAGRHLDLWRCDYLFRCRRVGCEAERSEPNYRVETDGENRTHSFLDSRYCWLMPRNLGPPASAGGRRDAHAGFPLGSPATQASAQAPDIGRLPTEPADPQPGAEPDGTRIKKDQSGQSKDQITREVRQ